MQFKMALGFSGSNGGIAEEKPSIDTDFLNRTLEISYFVNNKCNLKCRHCYVGYENSKNEISIKEWTETFDRLINMGALTFGNVGKEPLLSQNKTLALLKHLNKKRNENPKLRFGLVTNGTLLNRDITNKLAEISPDYIDVSLDGNQKEHDYIRGNGNYKKTIENLIQLPSGLKEKVFISFTLMNHNKHSIDEMVEFNSHLGFNKFLISPYVNQIYSSGNLAISNNEVVKIYNGIKKGKILNFSNMSDIEILLKSDYDSQKDLIDDLVKEKVIELNNLLIDEYGIIFNKYLKENNSKVVFNYLPFSDTLSRAIRISHDGYVGGCLEMFHKNYPEKAKGNLREREIEEIIGQHNSCSAVEFG